MAIYKTDKTKDGITGYRVRVDAYDRNGKRVQKEKMVYGKREAQDVERRMQEELRAAPDADEGMTVSELFNDYLSAMRTEIRETSLDKNRRTIEQQVLPYIGSVKLKNLTVQVCREWKNIINDKQYTTKTRQNHYGTFCAMLNYAVKQGYIDKNPLSVLGNFKDINYENELNKTLHYYTAEQYRIYSETLLKEAEQKNDNLSWGLYVFFSIAFYMGMRKGEIHALRWSDIEGNVFHIRHSISQKLKGGDRVTAPKNKSSIRDIIAPKQLMDILQAHKERWKKFTAFSEDLYVCGGPASLRDTTIENMNKHISEITGLPHIRIHDFRHTHASLLCNSGINVQEVSRRLGHSSVQETWRTYSHMYPAEESRVISLLEKL